MIQNTDRNIFQNTDPNSNVCISHRTNYKNRSKGKYLGCVSLLHSPWNMSSWHNGIINGIIPVIFWPHAIWHHILGHDIMTSQFHTWNMTSYLDMTSWNCNLLPETWPRTWLLHKRSKARSPEAPPLPPEDNQFSFWHILGKFKMHPMYYDQL